MFDFNRLYTKIEIDKFPFNLIEKETVICGVGSCFAEKFLERLSVYDIDCSYNPSGIIYNLHSINQIINRVIDDKIFLDDDFILSNDKYVSLMHHGAFSDITLEEAKNKCNNSLKEFREKLSKAEYFVITPSSSVVYRYLEFDRIVANCHKINNNKFRVEILEVEENYQLMKDIVEKVRSFNPNCKIIFTLSPIRHYAGNLMMNSRSKSNLLSAIYRICEDYSESCAYFPAYEIVHDEMRDYRFYSADLMHLTEFTQEIIFDRFLEWSGSKEFRDHLFLKKKQIIHQNHRKKY